MALSDMLRSSGVRNFAKLLSANVVAQAIGLLVYPILTRIYSPEDFGLLNLFLSIGGVLVIISTAEYYNAIVLPKEDKEAVGVVHLSLLLLLAMVLLTGISVLFSESIAGIFETPALAKYYWLMPIMVFVLGAWNILNYWYIRKSFYNRISGYQLSNSLLASVLKIGLGRCNILQGGLIYSGVFAPLFSLILSVIFSWNLGIKELFSNASQNLRQIAGKYRNFPCYSFPKSLINVLAGQSPVLLLTPVFGTEAIGLWGMALLFGFTPINLISKSLFQVLYQETVMRVNANQMIGIFFKRFTISVLLGGGALFGLLFVFITDIIPFLLGDEWVACGSYIRWMLPWLLCSLLTSSTGFLADIFFKQGIGFCFELLTVILRIIGVALGIWQKDFSVAIIGYTVGSAIAVLAQFIWLMTLVKTYDQQVQKQELL